MKRIFLIIATSLFICLIPFSITSGQDKKSEQKIRIVTTDDSGTKILLDTLIKDRPLRDSISLDNGKVIYIGKSVKNANFISEDGTKNVVVTVTSDGKESKKETSKITIVSSDDATWEEADKDGNIMIYNISEGDGDKSGEHKKYITWSGNVDNSEADKIIIINDSDVIRKDGEESMTYTIKSVIDDDNESDYEQTKYVINRDGMKVTIVGEDYDKVKELAKEIEGKINAKNDDTIKKSNKKK